MAELIPTKESITENITPDTTEVKKQVVGEEMPTQMEEPQVPEQTEQGPGPGDPQYDLWKALSEKKAYNKSYDEFKNKFNNNANVDLLYTKIFENKDYTKSKDEFYNRFFPHLKKNETLSQEPQKPAQVGTTPTSQSQLPSTSLPQDQAQKQPLAQKPKEQEPSSDQIPTVSLEPSGVDYDDPLNLAAKLRKSQNEFGANIISAQYSDSKERPDYTQYADDIKSTRQRLLDQGYTPEQINKLVSDAAYISDKTPDEISVASTMLKNSPSVYENYISLNKALSYLGNDEKAKNGIKTNYNEHNLGVAPSATGQEKLTWDNKKSSDIGLIVPTTSEQLFTSLYNLDDYTKNANKIITETGDTSPESKEKAKDALNEGAAAYVYAYTKPQDAKDYLSQKMSGEMSLKEPEEQQDPSAGVNPITGQPFTKTVTTNSFQNNPDLDKYSIADIKAKLDPNSSVDQMVLDIYQKHVGIDDAVKRVDKLEDHIGNDRLQNIAVSYYGATDPELKKIIDQYRDEDGNIRGLPDNVAAVCLDRFTSDPNIKESDNFRKYGLDTLSKISYDSLYQKYPEYAVNKVSTIISQWREDHDYNNGFYNNPSISNIDESVELMIKDGTLSKRDEDIYKQILKPAYASGLKKPETADFVGGVGSGLYGTAEGIVSTGSTLIAQSPFGQAVQAATGTDYNQNLRNKKINEMVVQHFSPNSFNSTMAGMGNFTGMTIGFALGGELFESLGLSTKAAETVNLFSNFYGNNYNNAILNHPGKDLKSQGLAFTSAVGNTLIDVFAFKLIPINKATEGITRQFKLDANNILKQASTGAITETAAKESFAKLAGKWFLSTTGHAATSGTALTALGAMHDTFGKLLGENKKSFVDIGLSAAENLLPNVVMSSVVSGFAGLGSMNRKTTAQDIWDISSHPEFYKDRLTALGKKGMDPKAVADIGNNMDVIIETRKQLDDPEFKDLTELQKKKYLFLQLQEKVYNDKATSTVDVSIAKKFSAKSEEFKKAKDAIINNKDKATEFEITEADLPKQGEEKAPEEGAKFTFTKEGEKDKVLIFYNNEWVELVAGHVIRPVSEEIKIEAQDQYTQKQKANGQENIAGVPGQVGVGQEPVTTQPVEGAGTEATPAGGVLQTPGAEGEVKATGEEITTKTTEGEPTGTKAGATMEVAPGAAKEPKAEEGLPAGTEPTGAGAAEAAPTVLGPKEGDVVELAPQVKGGLPRQMIYGKEGWKQLVGGKETNVGESVKAQAQAEFEKQQGAAAPKAEAKPEVPVTEAKAEVPEQEQGFVQIDKNVYSNGKKKKYIVPTSNTESGGTHIEIDEPTYKEWKKIDDKEKKVAEDIKKSKNLNESEKNSNLKGNAMASASHKRKILGTQTFNEISKAKENTNKIQLGDNANINGVEYTVQGFPYGKVKLSTKGEGTEGTVTVERDSDIVKKIGDEKKAAAPKVEPKGTLISDIDAHLKESAKEQTPIAEAELPKTETTTPSVQAVDQDQVIKKMKPFTDKMVEIEREFKNNGYEIDTDYDNEIQVLDKDGEQVEPSELPDNLKKLAADYEKATSKLGEFDASAREKALAESRKVVEGEAEVVEPAKPALPTTKAEPTKEGEAPQQIKIKDKTKDKLLKFANKHIVKPVVKFSKKLFTADPTESIVDEMNEMGGVNINVNLNEVIKKKGKVNTKSFKRKGIVKKPNIVSVTDFNGKPILLTISDELTTGEIVNPVTGQVLGNLNGGIGFNYSKGNTEFAWAYTSEKAASDVLNAAKEMYKKNPELYPDGIVPVAVVKMGKSAMVSNEAVIRQVIQNLTDPKIPEQNKQNAFNILKGDIKNQLDVVNARINKAKAEGKAPTASDEATVRGYNDVLNLIDNSKGFDDLLNNVNKLNIGTRPLLIARFTSGDPNIVPSENRMSIDKPATIALMEGLPKSEYKRINLGHLVNNLVDPSLADVPDKHIISFVGIDARADAPVKSKTHPNYPFALKGKGLGVLENTVHVADVMPAAHGNIINKLIAAEESGKPVTNEQVISSGLPAGMNNKIFKNKPLSERTSDYNKLVGYLQLAFPNTHFFTDPKTWEAVLDSKDVKKYLKDGEVVYGMTKDGHIYLNPNYESLNTPIHEVGHLHIDFLENTNPELFNKGISLVEGTDALKDAIKEYGEDGIAARKEALATLIGNRGETITDAAMKSKFQEWLVAVYKYIQSKFPSLKNLTPEQIADLTLGDFIDGSLKDILGAKEVESPKGKLKAESEQPKFSKESTEDQKLSDMKEIVKDLVDDGHNLNEIKDIVTRGLNDSSDATIKLIKDAHAEVTTGGGAGVPPTEKPKTEAAGEEPEMTKVANAINDAFVEGRFGTDALDNIMSNLQDTSTVDLYNKTKEQIKSGSLKPADVREKVLTQKGGTEADQAALIYDLADLKSKESSLMDQMINETDPEKQKGLAKDILDVQTQMQENALANRLIGRSASTIFRLRQMIVNREMDVASMEKQYMASKGIKELTPEQQKEVKAAYNKIKELSAKLKKTQSEIDKLTVDKDRLKAENDRLAKLKEESKKKEKQDRAKKVSDKITASQERINKIKQDMKNLRGGLKSGVDPRIALYVGEIAAEKFYQGAVKFADLVTAVHEEIKDVFTDWTEDDVKRHLLPNMKPEYFDAEKDYTKSEKDLRDKVEEYKKIQSEYAKTIYEWNKDRRSDLNEKKSWGEKLADNLYAWQRFAVLSYPSTVVKLAAVVGHNLILKPFRLGFQKVIAKVGGAMSKDFAGKMGVYGDPSLKAMGKYYSEFIRNFSLANLKEQFSGIDTKEILYGDKFMYDEWSAGKGILEMPGRAHGYIKSFVKGPEFAFAHEMVTTQYINKMAEASNKLEDPSLSEAERTKYQEQYDNYDVTNEDNLLRINKIALEHSKDAILMGDNAVVNKFRELTKGSGFWSTFLKTEAPIVKIPLNFINRALLTKYGLFQALTGKTWGAKGTEHPGVAKLIYKGTEGLTDAQGQVLSKVIQYGSMGAALFTLGYLNRKNVQLNDDGSVDVGGLHISKNLVHVPEYESFFSGVETAQKYNDEDLNWIESFVSSDIDILKKNPFMNLLEYGLIGGTIKAMTDKKMKDEDKLKIIEDAASNKLINLAVPGFVKQTAQWLDTKEGKGLHPMGEPIKRMPSKEAGWGERFVQSLELSIPGLRSMVPSVPELYSEDEISKDKTLSQLNDAGIEIPDISKRKFKVLADKDHPDGNMTYPEKEKFLSTLKSNYNTELNSMLNSKWKGTNQTTGDVVYAMGSELKSYQGDIKRNTTELQEMTDDVFNKAWNKTYKEMGFEKAPTTEYKWQKVGAEAFSKDDISKNATLGMYKRLNVDFKEMPSVDELETTKPLTEEEYKRFQNAYKAKVEGKLEELAGKEFVQKMKDLEYGDMMEIEGTEGTKIGQLAKKYDEEEEKKTGKKTSLLQKKVNSIMSESVNETLQELRYQKVPKSWSEY